MVDNLNEKLESALLDALTLEWTDNGNIMADAVRDNCITILAEALGKSFEEMEYIIEQRCSEKQ